MPQIHLDSDGTEIDDEDYFQTLEPNTELIAVFSGEQWIDVSLIYHSIMYPSMSLFIFIYSSWESLSFHLILWGEIKTNIFDIFN